MLSWTCHACLAQAHKVEEKAAEEPATGDAEGNPAAEAAGKPVQEPLTEEVSAGGAPAVPVELLRKSEQHAQSPKSAYA